MVIALTLAAALAGQGDVAGTWRTPSRNGLVEISHCGQSICGRLVNSDGIRSNPGLKDAANKNAGLRNHPLKGVQLAMDRRDHLQSRRRRRLPRQSDPERSQRAEGPGLHRGAAQ